MKNKTFMKGNWENLIIKTFTCKTEILEDYLPNGVELDLYKGKALFSMVAFTFSKVRFFGVKVPLHQQFGEINFRFYVKSKVDGTKGVVFLKEYAPKPLIAFIANKIYNEPFFYHKVKQRTITSKQKKFISYPFYLKNKWHKITSLIESNHKKVTQHPMQQFIVDRYIAFVEGKRNKTLTYKINHKPWKLFSIKYSNISNQILQLLPDAFHNAAEIATYVVDGSEISVEKGILQTENNFAIA